MSSRCAESLIFLSDTWSRTREVALRASTAASQFPSGAAWANEHKENVERFDGEIQSALEATLKASKTSARLKGPRKALVERTKQCWNSYRAIMRTSVRGFKR